MVSNTPNTLVVAGRVETPLEPRISQLNIQIDGVTVVEIHPHPPPLHCNKTNKLCRLFIHLLTPFLLKAAANCFGHAPSTKHIDQHHGVTHERALQHEVAMAPVANSSCLLCTFLTQ